MTKAHHQINAKKINEFVEEVKNIVRSDTYNTLLKKFFPDAKKIEGIKLNIETDLQLLQTTCLNQTSSEEVSRTTRNLSTHFQFLQGYTQAAKKLDILAKKLDIPEAKKLIKINH